MSVRAKFKFTERHENSYSSGGQNLTFEAIYDTSIPEDKRFCDATPTGKFQMFVNNKAVLESLQLGDYYYIDITPAS